MDDDQAEDEGGAAGVAAEQQAAGALALADDEDHGQAIVASTLRIVVMKKARARSSSRNRVSRYSNIVSTQRPPIAIRAEFGAPGRSSSASEIGSAKGSAISAAAVETQNSAAKEVATTARGVLVVLVVEAQQRLDRAEADDDAGRDDGGEHHLGGAVVGGGQVARVERQQRDRDQLREDARRGVGGAGRREAAEVARHALSLSGVADRGRVASEAPTASRTQVIGSS